MGLLNQILGLILSLSILILLHELGHFFFARLFKTRVEKFYLFFNPWFSLVRAKKVNGKWKISCFSKSAPEEWANDPDSTEWGLGWIPLGGYCSIAGMIDETKTAENLGSEPQPWEYRSKKAWQRLLIISGGVLTNFVLAIVIFAMMVFAWGDTYIPLKDVKHGMTFSKEVKEAGFKDGDKIINVDGKELVLRNGILSMNTLISFINAESILVERNDSLININPPKEMAKQVIMSKKAPYEIISLAIVNAVKKGTEAERIKLQAGDSITKINETSIASSQEMREIIRLNINKKVPIEYYRNSDNSLYTDTITIDSTGTIGVYFSEGYKVQKDEYSFFTSFPMGAKLGIQTLKGYIAQFRFVFSKEGAENIGGYGAIGGLFPKSWDWEKFWDMTAFLSIILAFMNILPIPALDGGHVMFTLFEIFTGRKPSDKFMERAQMVGMFLLLALLVFANGNDLVRLFTKP